MTASALTVAAVGCDSQHWAAVLELFQAYRAFYGRAPLPDVEAAYVEHRIADGSAEVFVGLLHDQPVGLLVLYPGYSSLSCSTGVILNDLYVKPETRRQGIGRALVVFALRRARERRASFVQLSTQKTNTRALALYRSLGFVADKEFANLSLTISSAGTEL